MAFLGKEYKFDRQENMEVFFKAAGAPEEYFTKLAQANPTTKLVKNGDTYTSTLITPKGNKETNFKSGVEFDDMIFEKIPAKSCYTVDGNKITQIVKVNDKSMITTREYNGDELVMTITAPSTAFEGVAKVWYKAV